MTFGICSLSRIRLRSSNQFIYAGFFASKIFNTALVFWVTGRICPSASATGSGTVLYFLTIPLAFCMVRDCIVGWKD